ncbi:DUF2857 domain-containing protein [Glaesserella parasuis]|uniref:DUF2857 domain-containing protein n=1 Tax=Glaesserella parasuis TaxID=738 RepID=UPI002435E31D|nr:DUF2857 domain-containing protein [Glaesserella parasuis]WGE11492.1 DUF2857 domain-containing protein [Glaesserella parasuis]
MLNTTLNQAIICEILSHIRRGEIHYCHQLGFDESELSAIDNLTTQEIQDLSESHISFASIQVNHGTFWNLVEAVRENTRQRNIIDRALELGASSEMLNHRFGWSSAEVSAIRKLLGIKEAMGRKRNATEEEEHLVWQLWNSHKDSLTQNVEQSEEGLDLLMFIAEESKVSLTEVSRLVSLWEKGNL